MSKLWQTPNLKLLFIVSLCILNLTHLNANVSRSNFSKYRLPTSLQPIKYNIHITSGIHDNLLVFSGNVVIEFVVKQSTDNIVLHSKELRDLAICLIDVRKKRRFEDLKYSIERESDFLRISAPIKLNSGERYRLEIFYIGDIQENYYGIYKTSYLDEFYNQSIPLAVTRFEPTNARLAFPCFDEPSFKAKFIITITHGRYYTALSNMPINGQPSWNGNMITTKFRETPPMPTYLVAFIICNYNYISEFVKGIEHRVFYPPNSKDFGTRAMTNAIQTVLFLEKYLGIDYPLPKFDHIHVVGTDVTANNWGLAIYNDNEFLATLETRDQTVKRIILQNYLISQQWLSNMVSPKWWSYSWINSGLATYLSLKVTDVMYPTWEMEEYFILTEVNDLMKSYIADPLVREIKTNADINDIVSDDTVRQMGAGLIKMVYHALGNETFKEGLLNYLNKFTESVADEDDFIRSMQLTVMGRDDNDHLFQQNISLPEIVKSWTHNQGIPMVRVTRHYNNGTITIQQRAKDHTIDQKWLIPLNFASASNNSFIRTKADYIMPPVVAVSLDLRDINISLSNMDWLILNKQQTGLYYVIYDDRNLELIAETLIKDHMAIHKLNRALLFRDLEAIIDSELGAIEPVLDTLKYLKHEQDSMPWFQASELINELWSRLEGGKAFELMKHFIRDIIENFYHNFFDIPVYKLSFADSIIKKSIFKLACEADVDECLAHARHQYKEYFHFNWPIDESVKTFIMCKGMQSFSSEEFKEILERVFYISSTPRKVDEFINSIRCVSSQENINLILDYLAKYQKNNHLKKIANRIDTPEFRELGQNVEKIKTRQFLDRISKVPTWKRREFKRKYEDNVYNWLKDFEHEQQTIEDNVLKANLKTNIRGFR